MNPVEQAIHHLNAHLDGHLRLAVAWSGGLDSTVLLHALKSAGFELFALHVNHGLQNAASDFEQLCIELAQRWSIPLEIIRLKGENVSGSVETWAREQRYHAMGQWLASNHIDHLLLGHHADDQVETVLLQLLRGSGLRGVGGMSIASPVGVDTLFESNIRLVRPFLGLSKADLLEYATAHRLEYCEDPTNAEMEYKRNWVRLHLLPEMRAHFPQTDLAIKRLSDFVGNHHETLDAVVSDLLQSVADESGLMLKNWRLLSTPSQLETLRLWLHNHQIRCGRDKLLELKRQLVKEGGGLRQVAGSWAVSVKKSVANVTIIREDNE